MSETKKETETIAIPTAMSELANALDAACGSGLLSQKEGNAFMRSMMVACSVSNMKNLLTPSAMKPFMDLQNTSLGFRTDKKVGGYPVDVVRDCIIEATLRGLYPVGNEFNIISSRMYVTKEGFYHLLKSIPNFTWTEIPGIPKIVNERGAIVKVTLQWFLNGERNVKELEFAVRVNDGMGADAIIGKAIRKARAWLYNNVMGHEVANGDTDELECIPMKAEKALPAAIESAEHVSAEPKQEASGNGSANNDGNLFEEM